MGLNLSVVDGLPDGDTLILRELDGLRGSDLPTAERHAFALKHLQDTGSARVRNAAALALADTGCASAVGAIVDVIRRPGIASVAGTLLYAIEELGGDLPLDVFTHVVTEGSYEARQQALDLLYAGHVVQADRDDVQACRDRLAAMLTSSTEERRVAAEQALAVLTDVASPP